MITSRTFFTTQRRSSKKTDANFPEVILRKTCTFYEKQGKSYPIPELLFLANRSGFLWLSKVFARCARKTGADSFDSDPDDHEHLDPADAEINQNHSDEIAFRLGILTQKNRRAVFKKYGITQRKAIKGDLVSQYQRQMTEVRHQWRRVLAFDRQLKKDREQENRRWKKVLDKLRGKQKRELNHSGNAPSARPRKSSRLFHGSARLEVSRGFRRPHNRGSAKPLSDGRTMVMLYVFAGSRREASRLFADALTSAGYKIVKISDVAPHGSNRPMAMDDRFIRPEDVLRAWDTQEVLYGWFM